MVPDTPSALPPDLARVPAGAGVDQIVWTSAPDGQNVHDLPLWREYTGQTAEELRGWGWLQAVHPDERGYAQEAVARAIACHRILDVTLSVRRHDGVYHRFAVNGVALLHPDGSIREWIGSCTDIEAQLTEIEQLRSQHERMARDMATRAQEVVDSNERFRLAFQFAPIGKALMDRDGRFLQVNPAFCALTGYPESELLAFSFHDLTHPGDLELDAQYFEQMVAGHLPAYTREKRYITKQGQVIWVWLSVALGRNERGVVDYAVCQVVDITDRRRTELALRERVESLQEADRLKDEFLSVISHELRTPLNFITGFGSILRDEVLGPLNADQQDSLRKLLHGAERMRGLVNNLLDMSLISAGKFTIMPCPTAFEPLLRDTLEHLRPLARDREQELSLTGVESIVVAADGPRIEQVVANLVANAIKFSPVGARIEIRVRQVGGEILTEVIDAGPGIAPEHHWRLFQRFSQIDMSGTRRVGGTGLGLSISKSIIEAHGGRIGLSSQLGEGCTFWFTLTAA